MLHRCFKNTDILVFTPNIRLPLVRYLRNVVKPKKRSLPVPKLEKRLDIVIMGAPNAGKSVLLNNLIKNKLAAISHKRHTTQREILGVFNFRNIQLAFYDTPGYETSYKSQSTTKHTSDLRKITTDVSSLADIILIVVDAQIRMDDRKIANFCSMVKIALDKAKKEIILVLNKVDVVFPKTRLLELTRQLVSLINGIKLGPENAHKAELDTRTFMISGLKNDGVLDLKNYLLTVAELKPWIVSSEQGYTSLSISERVEQLILEAMLEHTHKEIPYSSDIICKEYKIVNKNKANVHVDIVVDSPRHQKICVGFQGRTMLKIRQKSSEYLERAFGLKFLVYLNVRVRGKENKNSHTVQDNGESDDNDDEEDDDDEDEDDDEDGDGDDDDEDGDDDDDKDSDDADDEDNHRKVVVKFN